MITLNGEYFGGDIAPQSATISAENTWLPTFQAPNGSDGSIFAWAIRIKVISGAPVVTIQVKGADEAATEWLDYMSTDGIVNGGTQLKYVDLVPVAAGLQYRIGVKTGQIGGGSVKITYGQ